MPDKTSDAELGKRILRWREAIRQRQAKLKAQDPQWDMPGHIGENDATLQRLSREEDEMIKARRKKMKSVQKSEVMKGKGWTKDEAKERASELSRTKGVAFYVYQIGPDINDFVAERTPPPRPGKGMVVAVFRDGKHANKSATYLMRVYKAMQRMVMKSYKIVPNKMNTGTYDLIDTSKNKVLIEAESMTVVSNLKHSLETGARGTSEIDELANNKLSIKRAEDKSDNDKKDEVKKPYD